MIQESHHRLHNDSLHLHAGPAPIKITWLTNEVGIKQDVIFFDN